MSLQARQDEWSELYNADSIKQKCTEQTAEIFGSLTQADKFKLSAIWISDGISARHIDYPKSPKELQYMNWSRSRFIRNLFNFAVIFQTFAPFFEAPYCNEVKHSYKSGELFVNGAPTRFALSLLDMLLLGVYATDLYLVFSINPSRKSFTRKPWSTFRFLMCIFILIDCIVYFIDESQPRICRCIYPFLLIARRNNLKLMSQGLLQSGYHSLNIIKALFSVLVLWGFVGFVLFRNVDSDTSRFSNPLEGFYTALHCFTSRPYVLKALSPLFSVNEASTVFFVTLTLAADILCINLIVAVGSRQYKLFAASVFQQRLVDRRNAISCAFYAAANGSQRLTKSDWLQVCEHITGKYGTAALTAGFIFDLVLQSDQLAQDAAARLQEAIDAQDDEEESDSEQQAEAECVARKSRATGGRSFSMRSQSVDEELFFRCCALVAARLQIQGAAATDKKRAVQKRISKVNSLVPDKSAQQQAQQRNNLLLSSSIDSDIGSGLALGVTTDIQVTIDNTDEIRETFISNLNPKEVNVTVHNIPTVVPASPAGVVDSNLSPDYKTNTADFTNRFSAFSIAESVQEAPVRPGLLAWVWTKVQHACVVITSFQVTVKLGPFQEPQPINVFHSIFLFMHVLLVIQLSFVSAPSRNTAWFNLGWFLEDFFLLYMIVKVVSSGLRRYLSFYDNLVDVSINFAVFVLLVVLGESYLQSDYEFSMSPAMSAYLLVQLLRLFKLFFLVNDIEIFEHILPVLLRSSFIMFSVVYFFSIFGYSYFCSALNPDDVEGSSENDDASQWLSYENLLNFSSNLHSLFTLFEMGILGNWSMVMDAAALSSNPYSAFIFFYTYRLLITLCVLPILLSFILQAFLSALSKKAKSVATQERAQNQEQGNADDPDDAVVKEETVRMSKANLDCDSNDSGSDSEQATHGPVVPSNRVSFNISKGGGEVDYDSALEDDELSHSAEPAVTVANPMQSPNRESVAASSPDSRPTVFRPSEMTSKAATQAPALSPKRMSTIQFGVDRNLAGRSKNINTESITPAAKKDGRLQSLKSSGSGIGKGGLQHTNKEITVQYDNNSSSMVSIWAQDSAPHSNSGNNSSNGSKTKNGVSPISGSHNTTVAGGVASSSNTVYEEQVRSLQKQLDEALLELRLEREKHR